MFCKNCNKDANAIDKGTATDVLLTCQDCGYIFVYDTLKAPCILRLMPLFSLSGEYLNHKQENIALNQKTQQEGD